MTDVRADQGLDDEDRLPWLEAVEDEERGPSPIKLIAAVLMGLVAIGIVVGGLFWLGQRGGGGSANEELITSPGEYKVRPPEAGGMQVDNSSATQVATSEGTQTQGRINTAAAPETPVTQPQQPAPTQAPPAAARPPAPAPQQAQPPARPQPAPPRPQPQQQAQARPTGPTIQVGAYPSEAVANQEWSRLSQRYPFLGGLQRNVTVYQRGNQTFYRLRASGGEASAVCRRLRAAGQPCMDVN